jgi:hypothetical protein
VSGGPPAERSGWEGEEVAGTGYGRYVEPCDGEGPQLGARANRNDAAAVRCLLAALFRWLHTGPSKTLALTSQPVFISFLLHAVHADLTARPPAKTTPDAPRHTPCSAVFTAGVLPSLHSYAIMDDLCTVLGHPVTDPEEGKPSL